MSGARRIRVVVTRPIPEEALARLRPVVDLEAPTEDRVWSAAELVARLEGCSAVLALLTETFDERVLAALPELRMIANMAVGHDNVDVRAATRRGVLVTNTPGVLTETTADLAFALVLAASRRVVEADAFLRAGRFDRWGPLMLLGQDVHGRRLGIVGLGRIGAAVARRGSGFGMPILYTSRTRKPAFEAELGARYCADPDDLFRAADVVSVHLPLTAETRHFVDARRLALMRESAVLVNTARGPVVDEAALADALAAGRLFAAGLDVFEQEPRVHPRLLELDNAVLLPHVGSASIATRTRMAMAAAENLVAFARGERPPNLVNPEAWESEVES